MENIITIAENYANQIVEKYNFDEQIKNILKMEITNAFVKGNSEHVITEVLNDSIESEDFDESEDFLDEEGETNFASVDDMEDFEPMMLENVA